MMEVLDIMRLVNKGPVTLVFYLDIRALYGKFTIFFASTGNYSVAEPKFLALGGGGVTN